MNQPVFENMRNKFELNILNNLIQNVLKFIGKKLFTACGGEFQNTFGSIQSPGAPHNYPLGR